jgi:hypothetical protein
MPTLEVQLAKAKKDLDALAHVNTMYWFMRRRRADDYHGDDAKVRGLMERVSYLQQRIEERNERDEQREAAQVLVRLAEQWIETHESQTVQVPLHVDHTSGPTAQT